MGINDQRVDRQRRDHRGLAVLFVMTAAALLWQQLRPDDDVARAYIGPGAGIAVLGSFLAVLIAMISAVGAMLTWPIRRIWLAIRGQKALRRAKVRRVVVLGLDGLEPSLVEQYIDEGLLPHMAKLKAAGTYKRLGTTWPPLSPVAWSSFATGSNPGKHHIFDFITRETAGYRPRMSSVRISPPRRQLRIFGLVIPLSKPAVVSLQKSKPFWSVLGDLGVFSAVLRVPITFPPQRFHGVQLSAMCVPDLLGTQGTFIYYTDAGAGENDGTDIGGGAEGDLGGMRIDVQRRGGVIQSYLPGPPDPLREDGRALRVPFTVEQEPRTEAAVMRIDGKRVTLQPGRYTDWVRVSYGAGPGLKLRGICRFLLLKIGEQFAMYCTPIQIDPDKPVMPIAHPTVYSTYLARQQGAFSTLGLAEDTWGLSEQVLNEDAFLEQAYDIHQERQNMFFDALDRVRRGVVVCVFDAPDRIQHMFWRFTDEKHPARPAQANGHGGSIRRMYERMDDIVGQTVAKLADDEALFVMSDHGFKPFRRGVDLNAWLAAEGYLTLKQGAHTSDRTYLEDVDWAKTKAYAVGLAGLYVNEQGREAQGIVGPDEKTDLVREIVGKLTGLVDPKHGEVAIHEAVARETVYQGPYVDAAPDIIVGYNSGYRVSWDAAVGKCSSAVFSDNTKAWSGDHCVHRALVPGILLSNVALAAGDADITDMAPTIIELMGGDAPAYMDGRSLLDSDAA